MLTEDGLSPQQQRIYDLLADGLPHSMQEVHRCLWDDQGALSNVPPSITFLRRALRPHGLEILCQRIDRVSSYRLVRLIANG